MSAGFAPPQGNQVGSGTTITVQDEGITESATVSTINFAGAGVTAVDQGGGVVDVTIPGSAPGGGITEAEAVALIYVFSGDF